MSLSWERTSSMSSSFLALPLFAPSSSWSCMFVVCFGCWIIVVLTGVVLLMWVVGGIGCPSLLFTESLSVESHFKPSCAASCVVSGTHPCLLPVHQALSEDPQRDSVCCQQVICLVRCSQYVVHPWFQFVFWLIIWRFVEGRVAVGVMAAFFFLVEVWWWSSVVSSSSSLSGSCGSPSAVPSTLAARAAAGHLFDFSLSV